MLGDLELLTSRAGGAWPAAIEIEHHALAVPAQAGKLNAANGRYVLGLLDAAIDGAVSGRFDAIVTAPLQKARSTMPACLSPATPNISPSARTPRESS